MLRPRNDMVILGLSCYFCAVSIDGISRPVGAVGDREGRPYAGRELPLSGECRFSLAIVGISNIMVVYNHPLMKEGID